jgi:hypothetical protein
VSELLIAVATDLFAGLVAAALLEVLRRLVDAVSPVTPT